MVQDKMDLIHTVAEIASKVALDVYAKERQKEKHRRANKRLRDTKFLLRNYNQIKLHAGEAIASLAEIKQEDYEFFEGLLEEGEQIDVVAIIHSRARSAVMLSHIDAMLQAYQAMCNRSKKPEEQRRFRVLESMCLVAEPLPVNIIAERENIDIRTAYKDFDIACEKMSALLFGVQLIDRL